MFHDIFVLYDYTLDIYSCQFTSNEYINFLKENQIRQSMDGKSRWADNIMIERWFRSFKYEEAYLTQYNISEKHGRQSVTMCTLTTLNVVILHSIIRHRHPAIIRFCYWMIMQPKEGFSPLPSYIYQFIIKSLDFCLDN